MPAPLLPALAALLRVALPSALRATAAATTRVAATSTRAANAINSAKKVFDATKQAAGTLTKPGGLLEGGLQQGSPAMVAAQRVSQMVADSVQRNMDPDRARFNPALAREQGQYQAWKIREQADLARQTGGEGVVASQRKFEQSTLNMRRWGETAENYLSKRILDIGSSIGGWLDKPFAQGDRDDPKTWSWLEYFRRGMEEYNTGGKDMTAKEAPFVNLVNKLKTGEDARARRPGH